MEYVEDHSAPIHHKKRSGQLLSHWQSSLTRCLEIAQEDEKSPGQWKLKGKFKLSYKKSRVGIGMLYL